jgi:hypothetical protein
VPELADETPDPGHAEGRDADPARRGRAPRAGVAAKSGKTDRTVEMGVPQTASRFAAHVVPGTGSQRFDPRWVTRPGIVPFKGFGDYVSNPFPRVLQHLIVVQRSAAHRSTAEGTWWRELRREIRQYREATTLMEYVRSIARFKSGSGGVCYLYFPVGPTPGERRALESVGVR